MTKINKLEDPNRERKVTIRLRSKFDDVREAAMNTVGRKFDPDMANPSTPEMEEKYFISEHSPIRSFDLRITLHNIYYPTSVHFARHVHSLPYVKSSRPDRTGKARSLNDGVDHMFDINAQGMIDMARKRLCIGCCSKDTYLWMVAIKKSLFHLYATKELGRVLVPNCLYRNSCNEFSPCNKWKQIIDKNLPIKDRNNVYTLKLFKD